VLFLQPLSLQLLLGVVEGFRCYIAGVSIIPCLPHELHRAADVQHRQVWQTAYELHQQLAQECCILAADHLEALHAVDHGLLLLAWRL
jgi:hypothetical protein